LKKKEEKVAELVYGTKDLEEAKEKYRSSKEELSEELSEIGKVGSRKPHYSWSWFLETDDSPIMQWAMKEGMEFKGSGEDMSILNYIESILPSK